MIDAVSEGHNHGSGQTPSKAPGYHRDECPHKGFLKLFIIRWIANTWKVLIVLLISKDV